MTVSLYFSLSICLGYILVVVFCDIEKCSLNSKNLKIFTILTYPFSHLSIQHLLGNTIGIWIIGFRLEFWEISIIVIIGHIITTLYALNHLPSRYYLLGASGVYWSLLTATSILIVLDKLDGKSYSIFDLLPPIILALSLPFVVIGFFPFISDSWRKRQEIHASGGIAGILAGSIIAATR